MKLHLAIIPLSLPFWHGALGGQIPIVNGILGGVLPAIPSEALAAPKILNSLATTLLGKLRVVENSGICGWFFLSFWYDSTCI